MIIGCEIPATCNHVIHNAPVLTVICQTLYDKYFIRMLKFLIQSHRLEHHGKQVEEDGQSIQEEANKLSREISTLHEEIDGV
jgi:hypothetical protein